MRRPDRLPEDPVRLRGPQRSFKESSPLSDAPASGASVLGAQEQRSWVLRRGALSPAPGLLSSCMASRCGVNVVPKDLLMDPRQHVREGFHAVPEHECQSSCRPRHVLALVMRNNLQRQGL